MHGEKDFMNIVNFQRREKGSFSFSSIYDDLFGWLITMDRLLLEKMKLVSAIWSLKWDYSLGMVTLFGQCIWLNCTIIALSISSSLHSLAVSTPCSKGSIVWKFHSKWRIFGQCAWNIFITHCPLCAFATFSYSSARVSATSAPGFLD